MKDCVKLFRIIALVTVIIFSMAACDDGVGNGGGAGSALNGVWVNANYGDDEILFNNGSFVGSYRGDPVDRGTYTISGNIITLQTTHMHGSAFPEYHLDSRWYTRAEIMLILGSEFLDDITLTYSIRGNTLILTFIDIFDGVPFEMTLEYTRR